MRFTILRKSNQHCPNHYFTIIIHKSNQIKCWFLTGQEEKWFYFKHIIGILPKGQFLTLQLLFSSLSPIHILPFPCGFGLVHVLSRVFWPTPQVLLHARQLDHWVKPPSISGLWGPGSRKKNHMTHHPMNAAFQLAKIRRKSVDWLMKSTNLFATLSKKILCKYSSEH